MSMIGKTLAHYEITSQLGKGGMGEVYRAKDRKLGRDVAIKVLPEEFAKDADRVARFQREAKLLASLNHPNIAAIHGLEESDGTNFLVLELVEGETLAGRIKTGPIPVEESLKLALQIAEALEAAHEKGVIHRDLKPANIKVTPEGKVKVLDFGLAKAFAGEQADVNLSHSPTLSDMATMQGVILGTAAYMSPEQARGKIVDKRSDIWAFGAVLYEMLTGQAAFQGEDVTEILAAVVKSGVNLEVLPANLHPRVRETISRCLQKDLKKRYHDIADAKYEIDQALADSSGVLLQPVAAAEPPQRLRAILPWSAATLVLGLIIAGVAVWNWKPQEHKPVMRFEYELPEGQQFGDLGAKVLAISPDGQLIVYKTPEGLYRRSMNELAAKLIDGTQGNPFEPFFSPDGKYVGYLSAPNGPLKKIAIGGGTAVTLSEDQILGSLDWEDDDTIVYAQTSGAIVRISSNGGIPLPIIKTKGGITQYPKILPGGKSVLYEDHLGTGRIMVQSIGSGEARALFAGKGARYIPTGHIVYVAGNTLFAAPFNVDKLQASGGSIPVVEGIYRTDTPQYAISDSGTLIYISARTEPAGARTLVWVDRNGKEEPIMAAPNSYTLPRISPDGMQVSLTIGESPNQDIYIWDFTRKKMTRFTFDEGDNSCPLWSPDGRRIVYSSAREEGMGIFWKSADGMGKTDKLYSTISYAGSFAWSNDGKELIIEELTTGGIVDITSLSIESNGERKPLLRDKWPEGSPQISKNGRWLAYVSEEENGRPEIFVRPFPDVNSGKWQVSSEGGVEPKWSPDGRELFYRNRDAMMAVPVETDSTFKSYVPKVLFRGKYLMSMAGWDLSLDGRRFLMMKEADSSGKPPSAEGPRKINIVVNYTEELKQRVPVK